MLSAPVPFYESQRLEAFRAKNCAYAPREERFDRITRIARRLLDVPIALISIVEQDEQWLRSVQGIEVDHTPHDLSFCGNAIALNQPFCVPDTWQDATFHDNALVLGPPGIRSYLGWPLEISPGVAVGALCVIDTMPRTFGEDDREALRDLARMAENELKISAMSGLQSKLMMRLTSLQRKGALDQLTGCWNIRGFRELLALGVGEAYLSGGDLAVCTLEVRDLEGLMASSQLDSQDALIQVLAEVLRQRLPESGALARLGVSTFCALVPAASALALEDELAKLTYPKARVQLPNNRLRLVIDLDVKISWLADAGPSATADILWAQSLRANSL